MVVLAALLGVGVHVLRASGGWCPTTRTGGPTCRCGSGSGSVRPGCCCWPAAYTVVVVALVVILGGTVGLRQ